MSWVSARRLQYFFNEIKNIFSTKTELNAVKNTADKAYFKRCITTTSGAASGGNVGKYTKFATITCPATWSGFHGKLLFSSSENAYAHGILDVFVRTRASLSAYGITMQWETITGSNYADSVVAVESAEGVFDLYFKPVTSYEIYEILVVARLSDNIVVYNSQEYVDSLDNIVATSTIKSAFLQKEGDTFTGTLVLSNTNDLSGSANNSPALIIGGEPTSAHIEIDSNEIQAKSSDTVTGMLALNSDGGQVTIGSGVASGESAGLLVNGKVNAVGTLTAENGIIAGSGVRPNVATAYNLGNSEYPWNQVHSNNHRLSKNNQWYGDMKISTEGTTSVNGIAEVIVGNNVASGTANNASGKVTIYGTGTGGTALVPSNNSSANYTLNLPAKNGTLATTDEVNTAQTTANNAMPKSAFSLSGTTLTITY